MKLSEGYPICKESVGIPFKELFPNFNRDEIIKNKGKVGQLMEERCGLELSNTTLDFKDGELKTSELKESTAITMITSWIDDMIHGEPMPYADTKLAAKIRSMILMSLEKPSKDPSDWFFNNCIYVPVKNGTPLYNEIKKDYEKICELCYQQVYKKKITFYDDYKTTCKIHGDGYIHTTNGKYIQIRTKDAGGDKSKPIFSEKLKRDVTKKSRMAFYFHSNFKKDVLKNFK